MWPHVPREQLQLRQRHSHCCDAFVFVQAEERCPNCSAEAAHVRLQQAFESVTCCSLAKEAREIRRQALEEAVNSAEQDLKGVVEEV